MSWNDGRIAIIQEALREHGLDAIVCALPANVLMLSGYWPVVGTAIAVATSDGKTSVLAPQDEVELARRGYAQHVATFHAGSLERISTAAQAAEQPLAAMLGSLDLLTARIGFESGEWLEPSPYASLHLYCDAIPSVLKRIAPRANPTNADAMLRELRAVASPDEINRIRASCSIAAQAYQQGAAALRGGATESQAAAHFRTHLYVTAPPVIDCGRADGFVFCMSGPNAATAHGAYARSRGRALAPGDLVLVHCNSYVDGYWTDITRTFCIGSPNPQQHRMYSAIFAARDAALAMIRPGARAADIDRAARDVLSQHGFGDAFKHSTGHGVGFAAIDHNAMPRLHPKSPDVLREGMVFNVEPGIYLEDQGMRHCEMVAVTHDGCERLTPFQADIASLSLLG
ncbi:MAG TPA: Xaa-Pro peptidase family protein [Humisphaera sp.]|nr:Xaa-Pro peptidase family protein [Humisphaera sp.]